MSDVYMATHKVRFIIHPTRLGADEDTTIYQNNRSFSTNLMMPEAVLSSRNAGPIVADVDKVPVMPTENHLEGLR